MGALVWCEKQCFVQKHHLFGIGSASYLRFFAVSLTVSCVFTCVLVDKCARLQGSLQFQREKTGQTSAVMKSWENLLNMNFFVLSVMICLISSQDICTVDGWFFSGRSNSADTDKTTVSALNGKVPFEMTTADEKFLAQARFTKELSPLDLCHHMVRCFTHCVSFWPAIC